MSDVETLFQREKRLLVAAVGNADHQRVEDARRAPHEVFVTACERIERARYTATTMRFLLSSDRWARQSVHATHLAPAARVT